MVDLTVEQVRIELQTLIARMPTNTGAFAEGDEYDDKQCVYFLDQDGVPFGGGEFTAVDPDVGNRNFATPVCIVGHWVAEFHPELKDELFQVLSTNAIIGSSLTAKEVLSEEVHALLTSAQYQQDDSNKCWIDIDLDKRY